jgi:hypothetical protein
MGWKDVLGAAFVADIARDAFKAMIYGAGDVVAKKVVNDFGGENNPVDERWYMESLQRMDPVKREVWIEIDARINDNGGDGPLTAHSRDKKATTRRVNFAAMIKDIPIPTIKEEVRNSRGKVVRTTHTPDPSFKPLATQTMEDCVDMFLAEQRAQVAAGRGKKKATEIAQQKVEIFLSGSGFPIVSDHNPYRHLDEFIVKVPENALKAAQALKAMATHLKSKVPVVKAEVLKGHAKFIEHTDNYSARKNGRTGLVGLLSRILP